MINNMIKDIDIVIGMSLIDHLAGVIVDKVRVKFGRSQFARECAIAPEQTDTEYIEINDKDSRQNLMVTNGWRNGF